MRVLRLQAGGGARGAGPRRRVFVLRDVFGQKRRRRVQSRRRVGADGPVRVFPDAETESLVALAIGDLRAFVTEKDSRRAVLDALGAVVGRVPASALSARSHADGARPSPVCWTSSRRRAQAGLPSGPGPSADPRSVRAYALPFSSDHTLVLEESVAASRYYAALWRCAHLCASPDGARAAGARRRAPGGPRPGFRQLRRRKRLSGRASARRPRPRALFPARAATFPGTRATTGTRTRTRATRRRPRAPKSFGGCRSARAESAPTPRRASRVWRAPIREACCCGRRRRVTHRRGALRT